MIFKKTKKSGLLAAITLTLALPLSAHASNSSITGSLYDSSVKGNLISHASNAFSLVGSSSQLNQTVSDINAQHTLSSNFTAVPGSGSANLYDIGVAWYLTGGNNGFLTTVSGLKANETYTLSYYQAAVDRNENPSNGSNRSFLGTALDWQATVGSGGTPLKGASITTTTIDSATSWAKVTETFKATSPAETLKFLAQAGAAVAPEPILLLSDVSVVAAVPEPEEWALMLAGLPLVGWKLRNSKKGRIAHAVA